ncbi:hypothetical protein H1P_510030 [Hyella patelloides LEGE 07179]|uniref:Uncharacterized protein n=1 Tax=Hyella patelloides LEGE 07179 TaxID=945734 RepID=A0A563VZX7_9CYAN|nr:hypothetical protein H1P_510030 [Hyella patelloides LEGE 07179]
MGSSLNPYPYLSLFPVPCSLLPLRKGLIHFSVKIVCYFISV